MKKVIVACGSGVATSQTVASKVGRLYLNEILMQKLKRLILSR